VGNPEQAQARCFFFDEAHPAVQRRTPRRWWTKVEQVAPPDPLQRVLASISLTQNPAMCLKTFLGQLGNRVRTRCAPLRDATSRIARAPRRPIAAIRPFDTEPPSREVGYRRGFGDLLAGKQGQIPACGRAHADPPPSSQLGPITDSQRSRLDRTIGAVFGKYETPLERYSPMKRSNVSPTKGRARGREGALRTGPGRPRKSGVQSGAPLRADHPRQSASTTSRSRGTPKVLARRSAMP